jgi:hypothetical protein
VLSERGLRRAVAAALALPSHPRWPDWTRLPIARLRYTKASKTWTLYWRDRNSRFHRYDRIEPSANRVDRRDRLRPNGHLLWLTLAGERGSVAQAVGQPGQPLAGGRVPHPGRVAIAGGGRRVPSGLNTTADTE